MYLVTMRMTPWVNYYIINYKLINYLPPYRGKYNIIKLLREKISEIATSSFRLLGRELGPGPKLKFPTEKLVVSYRQTHSFLPTNSILESLNFSISQFLNILKW